MKEEGKSARGKSALNTPDMMTLSSCCAKKVRPKLHPLVECVLKPSSASGTVGERIKCYFLTGFSTSTHPTTTTSPSDEASRSTPR